MKSDSILNSSGICDFCLDEVCSSNKTWGEHHHSLAEIHRSANAGCIFCLSLFRDLDGWYSDLFSLKWPLYRWNLRRLARIRESNDILAVTFRPIFDTTPNGSDARSKTLPERTFQFHRSSDLGYIPDDVDLGESTDSTQSWTQIARWIKDCTENHLHCKRRTGNQTPVPTRLLDIAAINVHNGAYGNILVIETESRNITEPYVTLSHCWGRGPAFIELRRHNIDRLTSEGIKWDDPDLPKNFKDAIIVARHLERQYIWIDSLCIIQKDKPDFDHEAPLMHQYYRYSYCNIAAAASSDSRGGLFRYRSSSTARNDSKITPSRLISGPNNRIFGKHEWRIVSQDLWDAQLLGNPLYTRGWVFQERMLSPRLLHFSHQQIFYDCATLSASESLPLGLPRSLDVTASTDRHWRERLQQAGSSLKHRPLAGTADASVEDFWKTAVRNYTSCNLTNGSDKLMAIWGVAKLVGDALNERYGDGLWSQWLEEQLAWRVLEANGQQKDSPVPLVRRPRPLRAPTWSWASVDGVIEVQDRVPPDERQYRIQDHHGGSIVFQLEGASSHSLTKSRKIQSPEEEFESWEEGVQRLKEQRKLSTRTSSQSSTSNSLSRITSPADRGGNDAVPPKLESWAIEIRAHLRKGHVIKNTQTGRWTLHATNPISENCITDVAIMEVFLDDLTGQERVDCDFIVLAYSKVAQDGPSQLPIFGNTSLLHREPREMQTLQEENEKGYDSDEYDSDIDQDQNERPKIEDSDTSSTTPERCETSDQQLTNEQHKPHSWLSAESIPGSASFYGLGLLLKAIGADQYERIGSFRFRDYDGPALSNLTRVHGHSQHDWDRYKNEGRGKKIWLV